jgi:catechol 2,3-dioxygenase-like lactoylglutathione lyase family enzyme
MKRLHVSINVSNLENSIRFYADLFGEQPTVTRPDYAKWMLDDPSVNFVLEHSSQSTGLTHAGIQTENEAELNEVFERMKSAELPFLEEGMTECCYAKSEKSWTHDPDGLPWEAFFTHHQLETRGDGPIEASTSANAPCCDTAGKTEPATTSCC